MNHDSQHPAPRVTLSVPGCEMSSRERVARALARQTPDRVPIYDHYWYEAEMEFRRGLGCPLPPAGEVAELDTPRIARVHKLPMMSEEFDMDILELGWPDFRLRMIPAVTLEENDESILQRDGNDAVLRWWKHKMGVPEHVRYEIDSPEKWAKVKPLLTATRERIRWDEYKPMYRRARDLDRYVCYCSVEPFEMIKDVLGHEIMLRAMIRQPEWIHDIFNTYTAVAIRLFEMWEAEGLTCDGAFIYGDMAYNTGPFMSPKFFREFLVPYHKRYFDEFHKRGMQVMFHSDGDIRTVLPDLIYSGVDAINPLECKANMDLRELAPKWGDRLGFVGGFDVRVMATNDRDRIREEVRSKLAAAMPYRGIIYHSDHSVPPGVTLDSYRFMLEEILRVGKYE